MSKPLQTKLNSHNKCEIEEFKTKTEYIRDILATKKSKNM